LSREKLGFRFSSFGSWILDLGSWILARGSRLSLALRPRSFARWYPKEDGRRPRKVLAHTAMSDILESIEQLKYYRKAIFKK